MGQKRFTLNENTTVEKCLKCGNNTEFIGKAEQASEDCCDVWIVCKCGYDPTEGQCGHRLEDVWGSLDKETLLMALSVWNDEIVELISLPIKDK